MEQNEIKISQEKLLFENCVPETSFQAAQTHTHTHSRLLREVGR